MMPLCSGTSVYCTPGRSKKVVVALVTVALTVQMITEIVMHFSLIDKTFMHVKLVVFYAVLPVIVLIINMTVVCAVRRASNNAAANLGQQSTSSSSAVPNVMLVSTSLVYVLLCGTLVAIYIDSFYNLSSVMIKVRRCFPASRLCLQLLRIPNHWQTVSHRTA